MCKLENSTTSVQKAASISRSQQTREEQVQQTQISSKQRQQATNNIDHQIVYGDVLRWAVLVLLFDDFINLIM